MDQLRYESPQHDHIRAHSDKDVNAEMDAEAYLELATIGNDPARIRARLSEIDREWDVDRALMLNFAIIGGLSGGLAMRGLARTGRIGGWGAFFWTQMAFLAHHAIRGWCPPLPVFRRLGFRSDHEIGAERAALQKRLLELEPGSHPSTTQDPVTPTSASTPEVGLP
jgi:hypothetical protein